MYINYITKIKFLSYYKATFSKVFIERNILTSFRGASLVLYNPNTILLKLNIYLKTPK